MHDVFVGRQEHRINQMHHAVACGNVCLCNGGIIDLNLAIDNGDLDLSAVANGWQWVFNSWGGDIDTSNGSAGSVTMNAAKTVTATFGPAPNARIAAIDYPTLLGAYTAAPSGATIQMKNIVFEEVIVINPVSSLSIYTIKGGFTDFAGSAADFSTIKGSLKVRNGTLIADRLKIKP